MLSNLFKQVPELCTFANLDLQVLVCLFVCVMRSCMLQRIG